MTFPSYRLTTFFTVIGMSFASLTYAHGNNNPLTPSSMCVTGKPVPTAPGVSDLKFRDFYKMPIGPRGLEVSDKLLSLNGKRVRIFGYMANAESPTPGMFLLSPLPIELGDEDESLSDDIPPSTLFVHMDAGNLIVPHIPCLLELSGILSVGHQDEADGHVSTVRLLLDPEMTADIVRSVPRIQASQ